MTQAEAAPIPRYYLYGDQSTDVELDFLHIEPIRERSGRNDWTIHSHSHPDHMQVLYVQSGGGTIRMEETEHAIPAPGLVVIPVGVVHDIRFEPGTEGYSVTAAFACARAAAGGDARLTDATLHPAAHALAGSGLSLPGVRDTFHWLHREFVWSAPGRRAAIMAQFTRVLVALLRLGLVHGTDTGERSDRNQTLMLRYRELLEAHFRDEKVLAFYASALGVTPARLNTACKARAGKTASDLLHERILIEAKRHLVYTDLSVAEIGHCIGFDDPAYFNRFFARRTGRPPGVFRAAAGRRG